MSASDFLYNVISRSHNKILSPSFCSSPSFVVFSPCLKNRKIKKDEKKHHSAVDNHLSEQQFCKSDEITKKSWSHILSTSGSYARLAVWQSDKILVDLIKNIKF